MAQNYTLMARKNLLKPSETPKFYAERFDFRYPERSPTNW